jgi:predicted Ser/Thr protein kinase
MPEDSRLLELIVRWEDLRESGQPIDVDELCSECPELLPALRERLQALGAVNAVLAGDMTVSSSSDESTCDGPVPLPSALPQLPGYEVLQELGRGGMGVVYRARQTSLGRIVALKVLIGGRYATASSQARFKAEVEAIARLQHPNLIQVFEVGEHEGHAYFSMEYVDGGNLEDRIDSAPQPTREAAELVATLAQAMHAAHQRGVIHRDLKPANVLLFRDRAVDESSASGAFGTAKISDFGLAKRIDLPSGPTYTEHVLGTPSYMAPEQATGRSRQVGPATDVYSLGAILYRLLTGRPPFVGETPVEILRQVTDDEPAALRELQSTVPTDLETICLKCLHKQPAQRYPSAAALANDLQRFLDRRPITARPIGWWVRVGMWAHRRPAVAGLIGVSVLAVLLLLGATLWFNRRLSAELQNARLAEQLAIEARDELQLSLARQVADALDSDFEQLEMIPDTMADLLAHQERIDEPQLEDWIRVLVEKNVRIFGIAVALEPNQFVGNERHKDFCLYVYETPNGIRAKHLVAPAYPPPPYREREWYTMPKSTGRPWWSEPRVGQRADDMPVLTYSVPFQRSGKFVGVVTGDLSIPYFRQLHDTLRNQYLGPDSYSFVISAGGTFVYHPDRRYEFPAPDSSLERIHPSPDFIELMQRIRDQDYGSARATDFVSDRPATFFYARIPTTGGHFVLVQLGPENLPKSLEPVGR